MYKFWIGAVIAASLALVGCGNAELPKTSENSAIGGTAVPDEANGGAVTGKVSFEGAKPTPRTIDMSANPVCMRSHPTPVASEEIVLNPNQTVKNAFVWVKSGLPDTKWKIPTTPVVLDQSGCMYTPHVFGVMTGQPIAMKNSDPTNHNIHPLTQVNQEWNQSQPPGSADKAESFHRQEVLIPIKCNIHPWMRAYVGVVSHPFFAVTGDDGTFTIKGLPPGTYTVELVHEKYGKQEQQVTVGAKESKTADFTIKG